jgi:hypothetical protein
LTVGLPHPIKVLTDHKNLKYFKAKRILVRRGLVMIAGVAVESSDKWRFDNSQRNNLRFVVR